MTADQLDASAYEPWTSTIVGLGAGAAAARPGRTAAAISSTAAARTASDVRPLRRGLEMKRSMCVPFGGVVVWTIISRIGPARARVTPWSSGEHHQERGAGGSVRGSRHPQPTAATGPGAWVAID